MMAKVSALRELQSASGEELSALMLSVLEGRSKVNFSPPPILPQIQKCAEFGGGECNV